MGKTKSESNVVENKETKSISGQNGPSSVPFYPLNKVNFDNVEATELREEKRQNLAYIHYIDNNHKLTTQFIVVTGYMKLIFNAVPQKDGIYHTTDESRAYASISLDESQPSIREFKEHCKRADNYYSSDKFMTMVFGDNKDMYQYQSIIKTPRPKIDNKLKKDKNGKDYPKYDSVKLKLNMLSSNSDDSKTRDNVRTVKTKLIRNVDGVRTNVVANTIDDVSKELTYHTSLRCIIQHSRVWANKTPIQGSTKHLFGVALKLLVVEYKPAVKSVLNINDMDFPFDEDDGNDNNISKKSSNRAILEKNSKNMNSNIPPKIDDSDDEIIDNGNNKNPKDENNAKNAKVSNSSKDSDNDNNEYDKKSKNKDYKDDSDDDIPIISKSSKKIDKKSEKNSKKINQNDSDEEEDDNDIPVSSKSSKKSDRNKKLKDDNDSDDDIPINSSKKDKNSKKTDKSKSSKKSRNDDSDEDEKMKSKSKSKSSQR